MFDFDAGKLLIVGVIALIFIPPKDLPRVLRQVGQFVGKMRRMSADFRGQFMDAMREADMADIRKEANALADAARVDVGFDALHDLDRQMVAKRPAERMSDADHIPTGTSPDREAPAPETSTDLPASDPPKVLETPGAETRDAPAATAPHSA